jgi:hypothetical protein
LVSSYQRAMYQTAFLNSIVVVVASTSFRSVEV